MENPALLEAPLVGEAIVVVAAGAEVVDEVMVDEPVIVAGSRVAVLWGVESAKTCPRRADEGPHPLNSIDLPLSHGNSLVYYHAISP